jgi:RimJ/RimL family protein N-acetyltransferase
LIVAKLSVPAIETTRLLLRQVTPDDLDEWGRRIFADPDVMRYMPKRDFTPRGRAERAFGMYNQLWVENPYGGWLITDKADGQLIGSCELDLLAEAGEVEVGYALAKADWGKGIATEAARAATRFGFESAKLERIVAVVVPENIASRRVVEHIGFIYEKDVRYFDLELVYYAIMRDQFQPDGSFYRVLAPESS